MGYLMLLLQSADMKLAYIGLLVVAAAVPCLSKNFGKISVKGVEQDIYVVGPDWAAEFVTMNSNGFTLHGGGRVYFANKAVDDFSDPTAYWQTPLKNMHFAYHLDLSNVGCHCNAAGYFIGMPGPGGGEGGDYYCDANFVGGQWCPEYDTLESNKHTIAGTLHTCNGSPGNWWDCDRGGCQNNAFYVDSNMFCPEDRCTINTNRPFLVPHFQNDQQANIWMQQDGREASFDFCSDAGYAGRMAQSYDGMVFSASLWGGNGINMDWLDGMTGCWGECNIAGSSVTFSNFNLW